MMLHAYYSCPTGHQIALEVDALNDAPDMIRQPTNHALFRECWSCEGEKREAVIERSQIRMIGVCELRLDKIGQ